MRALLDVNVLIALLDSAHVHHALARNWFKANIGQGGWASCPITQNGCVRILSQPVYRGKVTPREAANLLRSATQSAQHAFWPDDASVLDERSFDWRSLLAAHQITDVYLLALAVKRKGRFVTFDRRVPLAAVAGAQAKHLLLI
ncbi:MAG: TA system VapC family ribonuclease toxin [Rudaea sp.]